MGDTLIEIMRQIVNYLEVKEFLTFTAILQPFGLIVQCLFEHILRLRDYETG